MINHWTVQQRPALAMRPLRFGRKLDLFAVVPERLSAEAMDDERAAEQLIDDLIALFDAGLIEPLRAEDEVRYAPTEPDRP